MANPNHHFENKHVELSDEDDYRYDTVDWCIIANACFSCVTAAGTWACAVILYRILSILTGS